MATPDTNDTSEIMRRIGKELPRMRVLLVDRHASARNTLRMILSTLGITAVHNAASTIEVMRQVKGALVERKLVPEAHCSVQLFSSLSRAGVDEAEKVIAGWLGMDHEESEGETHPRRPAAKERPGKVARPRKRNALGWSARTAAKAKTTHQQKPPGNQ